MAKIICPNKSFTGVAASVAFVNGEGETNDTKLIQWFLKNGYEVVEDIEPPFPPDDTEVLKGKKDVDGNDDEGENVKYAEFSYAELQALAKEKGLSGGGTKSDIIARLEASDEK